MASGTWLLSWPHQIKADAPPIKTYVLMEATRDAFRNAFRKAFDNKTLFESISIEGQTAPDRSSMRKLVDLYVEQNAISLTETSPSSGNTKVGTGYQLKATVRTDGGTIVYILLLRTRTDPDKILRILCCSPQVRCDEFPPIYEEIISAIEAKMLYD